MEYAYAEDTSLDIARYSAKEASLLTNRCESIESIEELMYLAETVLCIKGSRDWENVLEKLYFEAMEDNSGEPPSINDLEERVDVYNEALLMEYFRNRLSTTEIDNVYANYIYTFSPYTEETLVEFLGKKGYLYRDGPGFVMVKNKSVSMGQNVLLPEFLL